ncbi:MAG: hypothetical protein WAO15_23985 [Mycobacterium sp.]
MMKPLFDQIPPPNGAMRCYEWNWNTPTPSRYFGPRDATDDDEPAPF